MNSGSSNENRFEDTRIYPVENRMLADNRMTLDELTGFRQETEPTEQEEEEDTGTGQDPELDSHEEQMEEPVVEGQRWRYPLRERRAPRRFPDAEHVLLTDGGEPESFEEAKRDTHNHKWLSAM